eukprot:sb/3465500/
MPNQSNKPIFKRFSFVGVRHENGWWLAQLYTHIYQDTNSVRICWYDEEKYNKPRSQHRTYKIHDVNDVPAASVLCTVRVTQLSRHHRRVQVDADDIKAVDLHLIECTHTPKKIKPTPKLKTSGKLAKRTLNKKSVSSSKLGKRKATSKLQSPAKKKKVSPYVDVKIYTSDPLLQDGFYIPPVAPSVNCNIFTQAVFLNKISEVKRLAKDLKLIPGFHCTYESKDFAVGLVRKSAWHHAIDRRDKSMIKLLYSLGEEDKALMKNKKVRTSVTPSQLHIVKSGVYNPASLGINRIRPITMARGSKEGVNAFDPIQFGCETIPRFDDMLTYAIENGCGVDFIGFLMLSVNPALATVDGCDNSLLHYAAIADTANATNYLLSAGADPRTLNRSVS